MSTATLLLLGWPETGRNVGRGTISGVCIWIVEAWKHVPQSCLLISGFLKAEIKPESVDLPLEDQAVTMTNSQRTWWRWVLADLHVALLFNSDTDEEDFDGFDEEEL